MSIGLKKDFSEGIPDDLEDTSGSIKKDTDCGTGGKCTKLTG
jgi:hypothetical protein